MKELNALFKEATKDGMINRYVKCGMDFINTPYLICISNSVAKTDRYWAYTQKDNDELAVYYFGDSEYKEVVSFVGTENVVEFSAKAVLSEVLGLLLEGATALSEHESSAYYKSGRHRQLGLKL